MALRPHNAKKNDTDEPEQVVSQHRQPEKGRYQLQVDRQIKKSFESADEAEATGAAIKKSFPMVQVVVYDSQECVGKRLEVAS